MNQPQPLTLCYFHLYLDKSQCRCDLHPTLTPVNHE